MSQSLRSWPALPAWTTGRQSNPTDAAAVTESWDPGFRKEEEAQIRMCFPHVELAMEVVVVVVAVVEAVVAVVGAAVVVGVMKARVCPSVR